MDHLKKKLLNQLILLKTNKKKYKYKKKNIYKMKNNNKNLKLNY